MPQPLLLLETAWLCGVLGPQELDFLPPDCTVDTAALDLASSLGSALTPTPQGLGPSLP